MKVLIDRNGLQANRHLHDGLRLGTFLKELRSIRGSVTSTSATVTQDQLQNCDVFVITTLNSPRRHSDA